jgi:hypothetical protein
VAYAALPNSGQSDGVLGEGGKNGVHGVSVAATGAGVFGEHKGGGQGVLGSSVSGTSVDARSQSGTAVNALSTSGTGISAVSSTGIAVQAISNSGTGVQGSSGPILGGGLGGGAVTGDGVVGIGKNGVHGRSASPTDSGVWGENTGGGFGVSGSSVSGWGISGSSQNGQAGHFQGKVEVIGDLTVQNINGATITCLNGLSTIGDVSHIGNVKVQGGVTCTGDMNCSGDIFLTHADCAEDFDVPACADARPGTVMVITDEGNLIPSSRAYDRCVAGVVSGAGGLQPGITLGRHSSGARTPIALIGKVYCQVDAQYAAIEVGDLLTTCAMAGHAMKATDPARAFGAVIGKALQPLAQGQGMIPVLVALQ